MQSEYEIISHNNANFRVFLVNLLYRTPHIHKDYEISLLLEGSISVLTPEGTFLLEKDDIFVTNPFSSHEITAEKPVLILSLQVSPSFFSSYYPQIEQTKFNISVLKQNSNAEGHFLIRSLLFQLSYCFFKKEDLYELTCATLLNELFLQLLQNYPHQILEEKNRISSQAKAERMRKMIDYIDLHYKEKLLLSDIAEQEELDLFYCSHFFKDCFGMPFQNYLTRIRCEHARQLLLLTDYSLLDISIGCGFSDAKYFNKGFQLQYGCTPKEYRKNFKTAKLEYQQQSMLTTQDFLSEEASLVTLERYL